MGCSLLKKSRLCGENSHDPSSSFGSFNLSLKMTAWGYSISISIIIIISISISINSSDNMFICSSAQHHFICSSAQHQNQHQHKHQHASASVHLFICSSAHLLSISINISIDIIIISYVHLFIFSASASVSSIFHHSLFIIWKACFACRTVMLDRGGMELICSILKPGMDVLEYGSDFKIIIIKFSKFLLGMALEAPPPFSGEFCIRILSHTPRSHFLANLSKAGQAWNMTSTGNQRYSFEVMRKYL